MKVTPRLKAIALNTGGIKKGGCIRDESQGDFRGDLAPDVEGL